MSTKGLLLEKERKQNTVELSSPCSTVAVLYHWEESHLGVILGCQEPLVRMLWKRWVQGAPVSNLAGRMRQVSMKQLTSSAYSASLL